MRRTAYSIITIALISAVGWSMQAGALARTNVLDLKRADLKLTPAALTFGKNGDLYVGYRDKGVGKKSSAIWLRVFDPGSGKELRNAQIQTAVVPLPNGAEQFMLSPDDSLLLYSQFHGGTFIGVFKAATLRKVSETSDLPDDLSEHFPRVNGFSSGNRSVLIEGAITNHLNGNDVQLVRLATSNLDRDISEAVFANPIPESGFFVGDKGAVWISRANGLYRYDPRTRKARLQLTLQQDDIGHVLFLQDKSLLISSNANDFGYLYRFGQDSSTPDASQRVEGCGITRVSLSPDQQYGAALCEHERTGEWHFGAITTREAVIFDTRTLKVLAGIPIGKKLYPEFAIWHGDGKIVLVTQRGSNKLVIYEVPLGKHAP